MVKRADLNEESTGWGSPFDGCLFVLAILVAAFALSLIVSLTQ